MTDSPPSAAPGTGERRRRDGPATGRGTRERDLSARPGDGALTRVEAVTAEETRRWDVVTPSATLIGRGEGGGDVRERLRRLHDEQHPAMEGHGERMHRLEKARITHAFCSTLSLTPWERDRALGIVVELDLTAFGSQRAIETVALVVIQHVVDGGRRRRLGLHDEEWLSERSPETLEALYDRFESITDDPAFRDLMDQQGLDITAINRLDRVLCEQLDEQDLQGAALGRSPYRDPSLPALGDRPGGAAEGGS